jgi:gamma-glutamyltranspeptidase/glutathione hydrolase
MTREMGMERRKEPSDFSDEQLLDRTGWREEAAWWEGESPEGIVCAAHYRATEAGVRILENGGNAIDAAAAVSLALGVVEPAASGLGGMAAVLLYLADEKRTILLEGPCRAPVKAKPKDAMESDRKLGYRAVAVPTNPAVIGYALERYGTLSLADVAQSAVVLAESGHRVTPFHHKLVKSYLKALRKGNAAPFLLDRVGNPPRIGALKRNIPLARTIERLARYGVEDFYQGGIARAILKDMSTNSGFLCKDDFKEVPWPTEVEPLEGAFKGARVLTTPPPAGGFTVLEMLQIFDAWDGGGFEPDSATGALILAAVIRRARLDRRRLRLDLTPEWARSQPTVLSPAYASEAAAALRAERGVPGETTHFNVIDRHGNIVAMTQSIERSFGAKVATAELGFLYNGFMSGFKVRNKRHPHYLRPGAVARSNSSPTLVMKPDGSKIAIGSTGSERMSSGIFQVLVRLQYQTPFEAVKAQRLHCTPEGEVFYEPGRIDESVLDALRRSGLTPMAYTEPFAFSAGGLHLAGDEGELKWGVAEPRRDGLAAGPKSDPKECG